MFTREYPTEVDYLVIGGGTAGPVVASRLAEESSNQVFMAEWGPDDSKEPRANTLRRWDEMLEGEYDLDYRSVEQERGNSNIRMARLRILGGCSNGNTMITWRPLRSDLEEWVAKGAAGWTPENVWPFYDKLKTKITPVAPEDQNPHVKDVIESAAKALDIPVKERWNDHVFSDGVGFFEVGYEPATNQRSSASYSYLHEAETPSNLQVGLELRALRLILDEEQRATGAVFEDNEGTEHIISARQEVIVCCGAIDSPKLLMLSGVGPQTVLTAAGVECRVDLPGVGENLQDHAEGIVIWETKEAVDPTICASGWDAGYVVTDEAGAPRVSTHIPVETWGVHVENYGCTLPENNVSLVPNISKPASSGRLWITSPDPSAPPSIDYRYFTDPEGKDEAVVIEGIRNARKVAETEPFASKIVREVFPGAEVQSDEDISRMARATHQTVYHVSGTCKIGAEDDLKAVVDPMLRVRGTQGLRVVDASVFPSVTGLNPVGTILTLAERAAALILEDA